MDTFEQVIEKYIADGYEVQVAPNRGELPDFARDFAPDFLARKGDDRVLVKVKRHRTEAREDPNVVRLAEAAQAHRGWRFDLVVLESDIDTDEVPQGASEPSLDRIARMLDYAATAAGARDLQSSFVVAWAALEAAMRRVARDNGIALTSFSPKYIIRALYSNGLLARQEFDRLSQATAVRNAAAHGMDDPKLEIGVCYYVISIAHQLLSGTAQPASNAPAAV